MRTIQRLKAPLFWVLPLTILVFLVACGPSQEELDATATQSAANEFATQTAEAPTSTPTPTNTPTPTATPTPKPPTATPTPTPSIDLEKGLVAYWPFDSDANDASGNGRHGTVHGATLTTDRNGEDGRAYAFDGVDDFISVMDSPDFDIGGGDMTVLAWLLHQAGPRFKGLISHTSGVEAADGWWWTLGRGSMWVSIDDNDHIYYKTKVPLDAWVHLAFVKSGSEITFYVDGTAHDNPIDHGKNINDSDGKLRIGIEGTTYGEYFFLGKIDDVRFYNRTLTADEVIAAMNAR